MKVEMTEEQAIRLAKTQWWKVCDPVAVALLQLFQDRLCMNFGDFHAALEKALGRSVWTHELAKVERIQEEFISKLERKSQSK